MADAALAGTMLPLGDAKGTALALMVELLAAGLDNGTIGRRLGISAKTIYNRLARYGAGDDEERTPDGDRREPNR